MDSQQLAAVADQLAIRDLTARYNFAIDAGQIEDWVATFVEQGTFASALLGEHTGPEGLTEFAKGYSAAFTGRHCTTDHIIELDGDRATQRCYLVLVNNDGGSRVSTTAIYEDELERTPAGWRFVIRRIAPDTALH